MTETDLIKRIAIYIAIIGAAALAFAGGLTLMNVRDDLALGAGALICVAAPVLAGVRLWGLYREHTTR